jgi:DNA-directed RNA polymerase specialized sigma24 family protein
LTSDEVLVKRVQNGDLAAFGELVERYQDQVYGYTARMLAPEDTRDAS